jgi:hypothetical protein
MAVNTFADKTIPALLTSAGDAANGAAELQLTVPLLQNPEATIRADIAALVSAREGYEVNKATLATARAGVRASQSACYARLKVARDNFKPVLGSQFGPPWRLLAMPESLAFPRGAAALQPIVQAYGDYLEDNPSQEVPTKLVTAEEFQNLHEALEAARNEASSKQLAASSSKKVRDDKAKALRKRMRSLVAELSMLLGPTDPRWQRYGLKMPGSIVTPDVVEGVQVALIGPTVAAVRWDPSARADRYRVWKKILGVDEQAVAVGTAEDPDFTIENLPAGATVEIYVSAVNEAGESQLSTKTTVVTHP